jgi:hypothetical protein
MHKTVPSERKDLHSGMAKKSKRRRITKIVASSFKEPVVC